jgi:TyrR family helix-turn-helix protein
VKDLTQKNLLNEVLDQSYEGFLVMNPDGIVTTVNKAWMHLFDKIVHLDKDVIGLHVAEFKKFTNYNSVAEHIFKYKTAYSKVYAPFEDRVIFSSGKPITDNRGNVLYYVVKVNDISDIFRLKNQVENIHQIRELYIEYSNTKIDSGLNPIQADPKMQKLYQKCLTISVTDATVLITGESGCGKEIVANFIHNNSNRNDKPFLSINCGAIAENLIESELFGYDSGAFTGASKNGKKGIFEAADGGTLLLDEIGDMPYEMQVKLLRVLENKVIKRIGSQKDIPVDVRVIAATNCELPQLIREGKFRKDLYFRLNIIRVNVPPLRERQRDVVALAKYFHNLFSQQYNQTETKKAFPDQLLKQFLAYDWPGNVRELRNIMEQLVILSENGILDQNIFQSTVTYNMHSQYRIETENVSVKQIASLDDVLEEAEKQLFEKAFRMKKTSREIAKLLNVSQTTVIRKLKKYAIPTSIGE